jgi:hypothetical protein
MLSVIMLSVIMLSVIMLSVMALNLGLYYPQHFIFPVTYEWAHVARVLHYTRLERLVRINTLLVSMLQNILTLLCDYQCNLSQCLKEIHQSGLNHAVKVL